jgi:CRP/FNR family transcriptional regulator, cyclic AMP receptor protein
MSDLSLTNAVGFAAAGLVVATFCMRSMSILRWVAIASNVVFIAYGYLGGLAPVLLLHSLLLPVNVYRLAQLSRARVRNEPTGARLPTKPFSTISRVRF